MDLLSTIFFLLLFYYGFKFLAKLFAPYLLKKAAQKMQEKAAEQFNQQRREPSVKKGETVIDKKPQTNQQSKNNVGDYVDFEEIE